MRGTKEVRLEGGKKKKGGRKAWENRWIYISKKKKGEEGDDQARDPHGHASKEAQAAWGEPLIKVGRVSAKKRGRSQKEPKTDGSSSQKFQNRSSDKEKGRLRRRFKKKEKARRDEST